jgi:hypothetical protein
MECWEEEEWWLMAVGVLCGNEAQFKLACLGDGGS